MRKIIVLLPVLLFTLCSLVSCGNDDEPQGGDESVTDAKFIDLGLPSGLLWADRNIGAPSPYDIGDYFAWGETETKSEYSWDTYKFGPYVAENVPLSKYSTSDGKTTLDAEDDVATVKWGKKCRMPSRTEFLELLNECNWTLLTQGWRVTGPNGNSIFIPASGFRGEDGLLRSDGGYYWTSSVFGNTELDNATSRCATIYPKSRWVGGIARSTGLVVRPVAYK